MTVLAAARSAPHAPAVSRFVSRYFAALRTHDYPAYRKMLAARPRQRQTRAAFDARYGAIAETGVTVVSITAGSPGRADARVRFASRRPDGTAAPACVHWQVLLRLVSHHGAYLLSSATSTPIASGPGCG